ncbi:hypothetical protein D3C80_2036060 [compost metagenome]
MAQPALSAVPARISRVISPKRRARKENDMGRVRMKELSVPSYRRQTGDRTVMLADRLQQFEALLLHRL